MTAVHQVRGLQALSATNIKVASYTATAGQLVQFDCTSPHNNPTLTLPASPIDGDLVGALIYIGPSSPQVTWDGNLHTILGSSTYTQSGLHNTTLFMWSSARTDWLPLTGTG